MGIRWKIRKERDRLEDQRVEGKVLFNTYSEDVRHQGVGLFIARDREYWWWARDNIEINFGIF
jgi:hypothetical protein